MQNHHFVFVKKIIKKNQFDDRISVEKRLFSEIIVASVRLAYPGGCECHDIFKKKIDVFMSQYQQHLLLTYRENVWCLYCIWYFSWTEEQLTFSWLLNHILVYGLTRSICDQKYNCICHKYCFILKIVYVWILSNEIKVECNIIFF